MDNQKKQTSNPPLSRDDLLASVLASDLAKEVNAEFSGRHKTGFDVQAATGHVFGRFRSALASTQEGPVILIALAALQLREGYLQAVIREAAIDLIDSNEALNAYRFADSNQRKAVRQVLEQLRDVLQDTIPIQDE